MSINSQTFQPSGSRVLICRLEVPTESGGIVIPQNFQYAEWPKARVLACGPKVENVRVGNIVLVPADGGIKVEADGKRCVIIEESRLLAVMEDEQ